MHDLISKLVSHIRGMWRFRWRALVAAWIVSLFGWMLVYSLPDVYEASTRVYVDTETVLGPLLKGLATETDVMNEVNLMTRTLLSRNHLQEVARETDMDLRADTAREMESLIENLRAAISIDAARDRLYTITYQDKDPRIAFGVVQALLSTFMGNTLGSKRDDSAEATRFLEDQIREYARRLGDVEQRLAQFKQENVGMMPDESGGYYERLQAAGAGLMRLQSELQVAQRSRQELLRQIEGEEPVFGLSTDSAPTMVTELDMQIAGLEDRLAGLRMSFTDKHPDVIALKEAITRLEAQRDEQNAQGDDLGPEISPLDMNPVYQSMKIELNQTNVQIARINTLIEQQRAVVGSLQRSVNTIPEIEAELSRLTRDHEVTKTRYDDLLERLEQARLTQTAGQNTEGVQFRVIDPPVPPLEPVGPNRILFLSIVLIFSLGAGAAVSAVLDQVNPVFHSRGELNANTGVPVLGVISVALASRQRITQAVQLGAFMAGIAMLAVAFTMAILFREPAVSLASRVIERVLA